MPKMKSHSGAKKRFRATNSGNIKRGKIGKRHILTKKDTKRKRNLRQGAYMDKAFEKTAHTLLQK